MSPQASQSQVRISRSKRQAVCAIWFGRLLLLALCVSSTGCGKAPAPDNSPLAKAKRHLADGKLTEALASVDTILSNETSNYEARLLRGQIQMKLDDIDQAIQDFSTAIEIDPQNPDGYNFRYRLYADKAGQFAVGSEKWMAWYEKSSEDRQRFYALDPTSVDAEKVLPSNNGRIDALINKPLPEFDDLLTSNDNVDPQADVAEQSAEREQPADQQKESRDPFAALAEAQPADELEQVDDGGNAPAEVDELATTSPNLDGVAEDKIKARDLANNEASLEDDPLPHGEEEDADEDSIVPQITRNNLEAFLPPTQLPSTLPQFDLGATPRRTTGIQSNELIEEPQQGGFRPQLDAPRTTGLGGTRTEGPNGNPFPLPGIVSQQPRTTGFNSQRFDGPQQPGAASQLPWIQGLNSIPTRNVVSGDLSRGPTGLLPPNGFLPEEARNQFGPRLGPPIRSGNNDNVPNAAATRPSASGGFESKPALPLPSRGLTTPPLSMALPGTAQATFSGVPARATGNPFDPRNAPNQPQQVIQTLPKLPAQ